VTPLGDVDLEDSWVLDLGSDDGSLWLVVEAALGWTHPRFYWPPLPGEQHAYARATVRLTGDVVWLAGPFPRRASDASGELDYGDAAGWVISGATHQLEGEWGSVTVTDAVVEVDWESVG
jgi:hypothetical protein